MTTNNYIKYGNLKILFPIIPRLAPIDFKNILNAAVTL